MSALAQPRHRTLAAALLVLVVLAAFGTVPWPWAAAGAALVVLVHLLSQSPATRAPAERAGAAVATPSPLLRPEALVAAMPWPAILLERSSVVRALNGAARSLAPALREGELASRALRAPQVIDAIRSAAESGAYVRAEFEEHAPVERAFAAHVVSLGAENSRESAMLLLVVEDLTEARRNEQMRADFVANVSHELRTPLAALSGFIETLQGAARDDLGARDKFLPIMRQQAARMTRLIDDLLSLSRIERREHVRPDTLIDLRPILRHVCDTLAGMAGDRSTRVDLVLPDQPLNVLGDRDELTSVFANLVENALKYGAAGTAVTIRAAHVAGGPGFGEWRISVEDQGEGIPPEHLPRLTERFYRISVTQSRAEGGTGLGLALVKHILNRHRGRLAIASVVGKGSTFTVHLPAAAGSEGVDVTPA